VQEYRFQAQLNWDRAKQYLAFNTTILGAAVALSKDAVAWPARLGLDSLERRESV
jgi:hypothetical protein